MRVRALSADGDMTFGRGTANFFVDTPEAVAQMVSTRLGLWQGDWFLNTEEGTPYMTLILGNNTGAFYDAAIQDRILGTDGVVALQEYQSHLNPQTRELTVSCRVTTRYGTTNALAISLIPPR